MTAECQTKLGDEFPEPLNRAIKGMKLETDGELCLNDGFLLSPAQLSNWLCDSREYGARSGEQVFLLPAPRSLLHADS